MRRTNLLGRVASAAVLLGAFLPAGTGEEVVQSAWADQPVVIDGSRTDWKATPVAGWNKDAAACAFRNDGETLYVLFMIKDPKYRSSIEENGITLYFSARGAKVKDYGIRFQRMRLTPEDYIAVLERQGPVPEEQKAELRSKAGFILFHHQVLDRKGRPVEPSPGTPARPAVFKYSPDERAVVYEFAIPLIRESDVAAGVGAGPGQTVAVGFAWGGATEQMRKAAAKRQREQANFANEDTDRGGRPIIGSLSSGPAPKKYDFWKSLRLAEKSG
jgi:hypothetical protein